MTKQCVPVHISGKPRITPLHLCDPETGLQLQWSPPCTPRNGFLTMRDEQGNTYCNVGTIGHVDWGMKPVAAAVIYNLPVARHKLKRNHWYTRNVFG